MCLSFIRQVSTQTYMVLGQGKGEGGERRSHKRDPPFPSIPPGNPSIFPEAANKNNQLKIKKTKKNLCPQHQVGHN